MTDNLNTKSTGNIDARLSELLKAELPSAPTDKWFIRKVMNRLPDKKIHSRKSAAELVFYILGGLLLLSGWGYNLVHTLHNGLTPTSLVIAAVVPMVALFCLCVTFLPAIRRSI